MITTLEMISMKELTMKYMTARLMHEMSKKKEEKHRSDDVAMVLHQDKWDNLSWYKDVKTYYYFGKPGHIVHFCYQIKNWWEENAKQHQRS
jgi:hypothetical protein